MEPLIQKYIKYFYVILISAIVVQLGVSIFNNIFNNVFIFLSVINIILLIKSLIYNTRQQFIECKVNIKILCVTFLALIGTQMFMNEPLSAISYCNYFLLIAVVESTLHYRIKSIEYLEKKASTLHQQKEESNKCQE